MAGVQRRMMILVGAVKETPAGLAELINSSVVEQDVSNGNDVLAGWEHGERCWKNQQNKHVKFYHYLNRLTATCRIYPAPA